MVIFIKFPEIQRENYTKKRESPPYEQETQWKNKSLNLKERKKQKTKNLSHKKGKN